MMAYIPETWAGLAFYICCVGVGLLLAHEAILRPMLQRMIRHAGGRQDDASLVEAIRAHRGLALAIAGYSAFRAIMILSIPFFALSIAIFR